MRPAISHYAFFIRLKDEIDISKEKIMSGASTNTFNPSRRYQEYMPKIDMSMGSKLRVKLNPIGTEASHTFEAEYIGGVHYHFLIVKMPNIPGLRNSLLPRTLVEIQYQLNGSVCSFYTEIMAHVMRPAMMCFVTYPDRLSIMEIRRHTRLSCALPCSLHCQHGEFDGLISDISEGGCRMLMPVAGNTAPRNLESESSVVLRTILSPSDEAISIAATVKALGTRGSKISIGIGFEQNTKFEEELKLYLSLIRELLS